MDNIYSRHVRQEIKIPNSLEKYPMLSEQDSIFKILSLTQPGPDLSVSACVHGWLYMLPFLIRVGGLGVIKIKIFGGNVCLIWGYNMPWCFGG